MSVLSALIFSQDYEILEFIQPEHFYRTAHQTIFSACKEVFYKEKNLDINMIALQVSEKLDQIGGLSYLAKISEEPPPSDSRLYCEKLVGFSKLRKIIEISNAAMKRSFCAGPDESDSVIDYVACELGKLESGRTQDWCRLGNIIEECIDTAEEIGRRQGITGVPSGYRDLDFYTTGFQGGDLILIAARPGCGKTSFAINAAKNSGKQGFKNGFMSLEMVKGQIGNRFLSVASRVNSLKFRSGRFVLEDWERIHEAAERLSPLPIWVDDSPRANHIEIAKKSRALKRKDGLDILWIDYLGFLDGDKSQKSKVYEIESITRSLKALAKELKIPIVLICQLNRECEKRENKRPMLSDLRDSGALEQDADLVIFFYNDSKYHPETKDANIIECEIAKQRNGPTARIKLYWDESITRFDNLSRVGET